MVRTSTLGTTEGAAVCLVRSQSQWQWGNKQHPQRPEAQALGKKVIPIGPERQAGLET